jgi:hypothetical protein
MEDHSFGAPIRTINQIKSFFPQAQRFFVAQEGRNAVSAFFESPPGGEHKTGQTSLAANLIGGTTVGAADYLDFLIKNYFTPALWAINRDLHLGLHQFDLMVSLGRMECWNTGIVGKNHGTGFFNFGSFFKSIYSISPSFRHSNITSGAKPLTCLRQFLTALVTEIRLR